MMTKAALDLRRHGNSYTVVVRATDPAGIPGADADADPDEQRTVTVTITVTDVNEPPAVI